MGRSFGALKLPRLPLAAFARRTLLRSVFALLLVGIGAMALQLLADEKRRLHAGYEAAFHQRLAVLAARLRHPTGQLALLNADAGTPPQGWLSPSRLPFGAIDFDAPDKAARAVEISGCALAWGDGSTLCVAVGQRASAGAFVYVVGSLPAAAGALVGREKGQTELSGVHRVQLQLRHGQNAAQRWLAPLELASPQHGRLSGFVTNGDTLDLLAKPDRDFRAWLWQDARTGVNCDAQACPLNWALRVPVSAWREAATQGALRTWPPGDLGLVQVQLQLLSPSGLLFDSSRPGASAPFAAEALTQDLLPGETLEARGPFPQRPEAAPPVLQLRSPPAPTQASPWLTRLVRQLPAARLEGPLLAGADVATPQGRYALQLKGDLGQVDRELSATATRLSVYLGLLLGAVALAWLIVELGLLRRMAELTRRANALKLQLQGTGDPSQAELDVRDLRGRDELGILAGTLAELLGRTREHARLQAIRATQEREQLAAVGHEILSPMQALLALHKADGDTSRRYLLRMQAALNLLYGQASVSEALQGASAQAEVMDLAAFLREVAANAPYAGIADVHAQGCDTRCSVHADPLKLEDALTHLLSNAARYRPAGSPITLSLHTEGGKAQIDVHNEGPPIAPERLGSLFELGAGDACGPTHRGQGLFVVRTYLAKMGGAVAVRNTANGVCFTLQLPLAD